MYFTHKILKLCLANRYQLLATTTKGQRLENFISKCAYSIRKIERELPENYEIMGQKYQTDTNSNLTPTVLNRMGQHLHRQPENPLNFIYRRIQSYFNKNYTKRGNPVFSCIDDLSPVVTIEQNFDSLLIPEDHISRSLSDSYYVNKRYMLRGHTSAHQFDLVRSGLDAFLVTGDVYRRDTIDFTHYPIFHQTEGVRLFSDFQLFSDVDDSLSLFENGTRDDQKQNCHTREAAKLLEFDLKQTLENLMRALFHEDLNMRWVDAYFPFTHPSWELEIYHKGEWVEMLGCGVMEQPILTKAGAGDKAGWAFGLGLERLAMKLFSIPDIRFFWSKDPGFVMQFAGKNFDEDISFKPLSNFKSNRNDISFWVPPGYSSNDFYDLVRNIAGDTVEQVSKFDEFVHPKTERLSHTYGIVYRHVDRRLSQNEVNVIHKEIEAKAREFLKVEIR